MFSLNRIIDGRKRKCRFLKHYTRVKKYFIFSCIKTESISQIYNNIFSSKPYVMRYRPIDAVFFSVQNFTRKSVCEIFEVQLFLFLSSLCKNWIPLPCWKYLWSTIFLICFLSLESALDMRLQNLEPALLKRLFLVSLAAASAAISSAQQE